MNSHKPKANFTCQNRGNLLKECISQMCICLIETQKVNCFLIIIPFHTILKRNKKIFWYFTYTVCRTVFTFTSTVTSNCVLYSCLKNSIKLIGVSRKQNLNTAFIKMLHTFCKQECVVPTPSESRVTWPPAKTTGLKWLNFLLTKC